MKLKNDIVNLIVRVEHHLCPQYCGVVKGDKTKCVN